MPHKHKRDKSENKATSDLPPTTLAGPLPVSKSTTLLTKKPSSTRKRPRDATDDTPRAFARLMAWHTTGAKPRSGLDDGTRPTKKKRKLANNPTTTTTSKSSEQATKPNLAAIPKILPGERMSDFSARVDAALPIAGLISKGKKVIGLKDRKTKTEKRMQRMQAEWREVEARRKEKADEARDEAFVEDSDNDERGKHAGTAAITGTGTSNPRKKGKKRKTGGDDSGDDDPWAVIAAKRKEAATVDKGLVGLHDVVLAPPQFSKRPTEKFKVRDGAGVKVGDVPGNAGSLRRREELGKTRRMVVEGYRRLMGERREGGGVGG